MGSTPTLLFEHTKESPQVKTLALGSGFLRMVCYIYNLSLEQFHRYILITWITLINVH